MRRRFGPWLYIGLSVVVVVALVVVALTSRGSGKKPAQDADRATTSTGPTTTVATTGKVLTVNCFAPDRQVQDPQSPPCVSSGPEPVTKDTSKGIVDGKIRVAYSSDIFYGSGNDAQQVDRLWTDLENYINTHFMLYGRSIELVPFKRGNSFTSPAATVNPTLERADADKVNDLNVFASLGTNYDVAGTDYEDGLASHKIISVSGAIPTADEAHLASNHPFEWFYMPTLDAMERTTGQWVCDKLAKGKADFAGGAEKGKDRKFGLVVNTYPDVQTNTAVLEQELGRCGVQVAKETAPHTDQYKPDTADAADTQMLDLQSKGVTSVICLCHVNAARNDYLPAAARQSFSPEWIFTSFLHNDFAREPGFPGVKAPDQAKDQMTHAFGLSFRPETLPVDQLPVTQAVRSVDPDWQWGPLLAGQGQTFAAQVWNWFYYKALLVLASGIQSAGPNLTPDTFAQGLQRTSFPVPAGSNAGKASFKADHTMVEDAAVIWWSASAPSFWGDDTSPVAAGRTVTAVGPGTWCYANKGARIGPTDVAAAAAPFAGNCDGAAT